MHVTPLADIFIKQLFVWVDEEVYIVWFIFLDAIA